MFFSDWYALLRILVVGVCSYAALVFMLRVYGKRTLSQFNAFDFVVTVALGSTLATILLSKNVALVEGLFAFALLLSLQLVVTWLAVRVKTVDRLVKSEPRLLYYAGVFLSAALRDERVTEGEVLSAIREQGIASMADVEAIILETSGTISAVVRPVIPGRPTFADVKGYDGAGC